ADEVELRQPGERLVYALGGEQCLPAPGHTQRRREKDRVGAEQVPAIARADQVDCAPNVDLPEQVGDHPRAHDHLKRDPNRARDAHGKNFACTRRSASIASTMSSSEWAGDSGSESTSRPACSATGSGGWSVKRSR